MQVNATAGWSSPIAFESAIKLVAFLSVGIFVTYGLFNGFGDILAEIKTGPFAGSDQDRQRLRGELPRVDVADVPVDDGRHVPAPAVSRGSS